MKSSGIPRHGRRDENEDVIVYALRAAGADVEFLSAASVPDLLVGYQGNNYLVEIKTDKGRLSKGQKEWHDEWRGGKPVVIRSIDDVVEWLTQLSRQEQRS